MIGVKELCALLVAGSMGAGSVVAVQQAKPAVHKTKAKPAKAKLHKTASRKPARPSLHDCSLNMGAPGGLPELASIAPVDPLPIAALTSASDLARAGSGGGFRLPPLVGPGDEFGFIGPGIGGGGGSGGGSGGGGGGSPIDPPTPPGGEDGKPLPTVPEPASWAMMVSGFGLIGLALRRDRTAADA